MSLVRATHGRNDLLFTADEGCYIDLISSTGAVFLGHANEAVNRRVNDQLARISCSWTSVMDIQDECKAFVQRHTGNGFELYSLYSSGMEAAEVAMRIAFHETRRPEIVGFDQNNHGKSVALQNLTGPDPDVPLLGPLRHLPFIPLHSEERVLDELESTLRRASTAAVFVESMQGKGGGYAASREFYVDLQRLCRESGTLIICDEIFTGFHRTGPCFHYPTLDIAPDIILIGKAIANGFPASGVMLRSTMRYHPKDFRLSSTFSGNPIACAAVLGTLAEMERIDVERQVARIEQTFTHLVAERTVELRLRGAACFVELESPRTAAAVKAHLFQHDVLALQRGAILGFWPPATIPVEHLERVVEVTNEALRTFG